MTEQQLRNLVVETAQSYLGCNEQDGTHKQIIDLYNSHKPLARGYAVKYTDAWCATFVSAVSIKVGLTDIMPTECGCESMIQLYKAHDVSQWEEDESVTPQKGDVIFYDWEDTGAGNNTGSADHVGIVAGVIGSTITVIEGNYSNSVKKRTLQVNSKYIRGYGIPGYYTKSEMEDNEEMPNIETLTEDQITALWGKLMAPLKDNDASTWSETGRQWAMDNGIILGDGTGNYQWEAPLTREAMCVMMYRFAQFIGKA
ncbi:CHAP domain-containing protein [Oscillibacter sp.]|uniref:CHAP domain-containing protein n=1 Tax=Oscillibacter sp. TaxID=1945593 RepID=UPI0026388028|nr:CHAP domain-containing protein [Oscillibacter sp.]MDD3347320.1 CHAP domain-containing protein [Oscillibacter sp.]